MTVKPKISIKKKIHRKYVHFFDIKNASQEHPSSMFIKECGLITANT